MDHNSYFYNEADQMHNFNESFQTFDEQVGVGPEYYPTYEHEEMRWPYHHDFSWDSPYQQNNAYQEHNSYFSPYHSISENNYYVEHQFDPDNYQYYSESSCVSEPSTEPTPLQKMLFEYIIKNSQREDNYYNQMDEILNFMQNQVEEMTKALTSREPESSFSTELHDSYDSAYYDDNISLTDYADQEGPQETKLEQTETFQSTIIKEYGEIEYKEEETIPNCVVKVSKEEFQEEAVPDLIIKSNTPSLTFDVQQQDAGYVLEKKVLEQPSNEEGSYFIKVALEDDTEVLKRVSFGVDRKLIQSKEHLKILILVKARAFDRAGVG